MSFEPARCPHCAADIQVPTDRATARCMICGGEVDVQASVQALDNPVAAPASNWKDVLLVAWESIDSGNYQEANAQLTSLLEQEPANGAVWMCKALIAAKPDEVVGYAQKGFNYGFDVAGLRPALARRFFDRGFALIGCTADGKGGLNVEPNSASGSIEEARRQAFAAGVHCDFAYRYFAMAFALLGVSYELAPKEDVGECLSLMESLVNGMPAAGRAIDSPEGHPYEAKNWFNHTLPAIYELRQRIRQDFPQAEITAPAMPADIAAKGNGNVPIILLVAMGGFGVTFAIGLLRGESIGLCAAMGAAGAVLAPIMLAMKMQK